MRENACNQSAKSMLSAVVVRQNALCRSIVSKATHRDKSSHSAMGSNPQNVRTVDGK